MRADVTEAFYTRRNVGMVYFPTGKVVNLFVKGKFFQIDYCSMTVLRILGQRSTL